jgi:2-haloacid dehalogenase
MLTALVRNTGLDSILEATISIDAKGIFKPSPDAYSLIQARLDVNPDDVLFVSSNPWDAIGAKAAGLKVAWIERVTQEAMADACRKRDLVAPLTMFKALRMQMDELGMAPDYKVDGLSALSNILSASRN